MLEDLEVFELSDEDRAQLLADLEEDHFEVWPENWDYFLMFLRLQTQWRVSMAGAIGLDYAVALQFCDLHGWSGIDRKREMMDALALMEREVLSVWSKEK